MLELKNICFEKDGKKILDNINLKFEKHKFYVITGPNGSGKSSLAKIIMGITKPTSGVILLNGQNITDLSIPERAKLGVGYAFQIPALFKGITVFKLLEIASGKKLTSEEACALLSKTGLCAREYLNREVNNSLSGGELKRIEIATILAKNPAVAIFDEPEAGIDLWSFQNLTKLFKELDASFNGVCLVISHQERILKLADKIILLEGGKVKKEGEAKEFKNLIVCPKGVSTYE